MEGKKMGPGAVIGISVASAAILSFVVYMVVSKFNMPPVNQQQAASSGGLSSIITGLQGLYGQYVNATASSAPTGDAALDNTSFGF
jgi:hypothetical protein